MNRTLAFTLAALLSAAPLAAADVWKVYVYTAEDAGGFVNQDLKDRRASVADVQKALGDKRYRDRFALVDTAESADLQVEVAWRGEVDSGAKTGQTTVWVPGVATKSTHTIMQPNLRLVLHVGEHAEDFWAVDQGKHDQRFWSDLAKMATQKIATWVSENETTLQARR